MTRKVRYKTQTSRLVGSLTAYADSLDSLGAQAVVNAARLGAETMRSVAEDSGTGWPNGGPAGGPRSDTGDMIRDITYDKVARRGVSKSGRVSRTARFGWINRKRDYYLYQDRGFINVKKNPENRGVTWTTGMGGWTEGMAAIELAQLVSRETFRAEMSRLTRKSWRKSKRK